MINILELGFMREFIHKFIRIQYYTKMNSLYRTIYFAKFDRDKAYLKHNVLLTVTIQNPVQRKFMNYNALIITKIKMQ